MIEAEEPYVDADNVLYVPLQLAGAQTFGYLRLQRAMDQAWTQQEIAFVSTAVEDVSQALEVSRLLEQSRRTASREQLVGEITARVRESLDMNAVMQAAVRELGEALPGAQVQVRLGAGPSIE